MPRKPKVRAPYKMVSPPTWELARAAYLGGETAHAVAGRFDIGLSNLRQKIYREGWSKRALADARVVAGPGGPAPQPRQVVAPDTDKDLVLDVVLYRAREALTAGKGAEATALLKALREYIVVLDDVSEAHEITEWIDKACGVSQPELASRLTEALTMTQLRQMWAPLDQDEARWRDDARKMAAEKRTASAGGGAAVGRVSPDPGEEA